MRSKAVTVLEDTDILKLFNGEILELSDDIHLIIDRGVSERWRRAPLPLAGARRRMREAWIPCPRPRCRKGFPSPERLTKHLKNYHHVPGVK